MGIYVCMTWTNHNPETVWNKLAARLGREPTPAEAKAEVLRILFANAADMAGSGRLLRQHNHAVRRRL